MLVIRVLRPRAKTIDAAIDRNSNIVKSHTSTASLGSGCRDSYICRLLCLVSTALGRRFGSLADLWTDSSLTAALEWKADVPSWSIL
jgi:hypothetical protein